MKKISASVLFVVFIAIVLIATGCAGLMETRRGETRTNQGGAVGLGLGLAFCHKNPYCIGAATLLGLFTGSFLGTAESDKIAEPKVVEVGDKKVIMVPTGIPFPFQNPNIQTNIQQQPYSNEECRFQPTIESQVECFREKTRNLRSLTDAENEYARERARRRY
ncbi:MAG: hypothetical protein WC587_01095 [Candidatus Paceibacterota bacterium]